MPAYHAPYIVHVNLQDQFCNELDHFMSLGIIKRHGEGSDTTPWVNSGIPKEKKDKDVNTKLYICLDRHDLNEALIREPYYYWNVEDIILRLECFLVFTICNMKKRYWLVLLDHEPPLLTSLPFPIKVSITFDFHLELLFLVMDYESQSLNTLPLPMEVSITPAFHLELLFLVMCLKGISLTHKGNLQSHRLKYFIMHGIPLLLMSYTGTRKTSL